MSNYIIVSDSHGEEKILADLVQRYPDAMILHCGDSELSDSHPIFQQLTTVAGNCDFESEVKQGERFIQHGHDRIFLCHGHRYNVKQSPLNVMYAAMEHHATIALFGHSHVPYVSYESSQDLLVLNPGSIAYPRILPAVKTYVHLETFETHYIVTWYNEQHQPLKTMTIERTSSHG